MLAQHPDIFVCNPKEPEFFNRFEEYNKGIGQYAKLFESGNKATAVGEGSTSYTKSGAFPLAAERIKQHLPHVKLIYIMRDPIARIESHWMHSVRSGSQRWSDFPNAIVKDENFIDTSQYWKQYQHLRNYFSPEQILLMLYEDFKSNPTDVLERCFSYLNVGPLTLDEYRSEHVSVGSMVDRPIIGRLQEVTLIRSIFRMIPRSLRDSIKRPFQTKIGRRPKWNRSALEYVLARIADDAKTMLFHIGRSNAWHLTADNYMKVTRS